MKLPKCDYCEMEAQYDFVEDSGEWRYACVTHWIKHRASRQLGPGHARHLVAGEQPPRRPEGYTPQPIDPTRLVKPRVAPTLQAAVDRPLPATNGGTTIGNVRKPKTERVKPPKEFQDMEPKGMEIKDPRPGSVMAITLELVKKNGGATIDEIQAAIGVKHDALKLLQWMNENRGYGWKRDGEGKIQVVYYGAS